MIDCRATAKEKPMKLTKARLKRIIKEELATYQEGEETSKWGPVPDLRGRTYNFKVSRGDRSGGMPGSRGPMEGFMYYLINVPYEMLDTSRFEKFKLSHKDPERFLRPSMELLSQTGLDGGLQPETILMDGAPPPPPRPPKIIDASTL
jgi:hypothetical protein